MERKQRTGPGERRNPGKGRPGLAGVRILVRMGILVWLIGAGNEGIEAAMPELQELGTWRPIWRYQPVISEWAHVNQGLIEIPEYMLDTPIAYGRRRDTAGNPYSMEVPFADHLSVVRLLGGWNANPNIPFGGSAEADLAYRDNSGEVTYRWDLLEERLRPYVVESGYRSLTLVMDNVPSGIARNPVWRNFGQASCPADFEEWEAFMRGLAEQLVGLYGYDVARYFRFRVGTETHSTARFQGSQEDYFRHYNHTSAGIRSVLPEAEIGPGNLFFKFPDIRDDNVDYYALAEHVNTGSNHATGGIGDSYDFLGASYYYTKDSPQTPQARGIKPSVADFDEFWDLSAQLSGKGGALRREIQEFGILASEGQTKYGHESGHFGCALIFQTFVELLGAGIDAVWHWHAPVLDRLAASRIEYLMGSQGWLYLMFEQMRGGYGAILPCSVDTPDGTLVRALGSFRPGEAVILLGSLDGSRLRTTAPDTEQASVSLPVELLNLEPATAMVERIIFDETASVYDRIRKDLLREGLLASDLVGTSVPVIDAINTMAVPQGREYILDNWETYRDLMRSALTPVPIQLDWQLQGEAWKFTVPVDPNTVHFYRIRGSALLPERRLTPSADVGVQDSGAIVPDGPLTLGAPPDPATVFLSFDKGLTLPRLLQVRLRVKVESAPAQGTIQVYARSGTGWREGSVIATDLESGDWMRVSEHNRYYHSGEWLEFDLTGKLPEGRQVDFKLVIDRIYPGETTLFSRESGTPPELLLRYRVGVLEPHGKGALPTATAHSTGLEFTVGKLPLLPDWACRIEEFSTNDLQWRTRWDSREIGPEQLEGLQSNGLQFEIPAVGKQTTLGRCMLFPRIRERVELTYEGNPTDVFLLNMADTNLDGAGDVFTQVPGHPLSRVGYRSGGVTGYYEMILAYRIPVRGGSLVRAKLGFLYGEASWGTPGLELRAALLDAFPETSPGLYDSGIFDRPLEISLSPDATPHVNTWVDVTSLVHEALQGRIGNDEAILALRLRVAPFADGSLPLPGDSLHFHEIGGPSSSASRLPVLHIEFFAD